MKFLSPTPPHPQKSWGFPLCINGIQVISGNRKHSQPLLSVNLKPSGVLHNFSLFFLLLLLLFDDTRDRFEGWERILVGRGEWEAFPLKPGCCLGVSPIPKLPGLCNGMEIINTSPFHLQIDTAKLIFFCNLWRGDRVGAATFSPSLLGSHPAC